MRKIKTKYCKFCNKTFETNIHNKIYCSKDCRRAANKAVHVTYTRETYRKNTGIYKKWAKELKIAGYTVLPPVQRQTIINKIK